MLKNPRQFRAALRIHRDLAALARRRRHARQAQQRRIRDGLVERDLVLRPGGQSVAARRFQHHAGAGRLIRRIGVRRGGAALHGRDRDRYRRFDPPARSLHRDRRRQADLRPLLALGHRGVRVLARPGGSDRAHHPRCRDPDALDGGARSEGYDLGRSRGAGLRGRDRKIRQGHEDRHSRRSTASTACRRKSKSSGAKARHG